MEKKKTATSKEINGLTSPTEAKVLKNSHPTKISLVLQHLESGRSITPLLALRLYRSMSLRDIIFTLRGRGYHIVTKMVENEETGSRFARYSLKRDSQK